MFLKDLQKVFILIVITSSILLVYIWYEDYNFSKNPLDRKYLTQIERKHLELRFLAKKHFNITRVFPIIVSDELKSKNFGMTTYNQNGTIKIYLNKNRFKENSSLMINDTLPHEYAHAIMFTISDFSDENSGHSKRWQYICKKLEGINCNRFAQYKDILIEKTNFFK
jgi:hypothetical protein